MNDKKCAKHPKYKGKTKPKYECTTCLAYYFLLKKPRAMPMPTKVIGDKTKYNRKKKHKDKDV